MGNEGSLPLVAVFDSYIVISPVDVKLGEDFGIPQFVDKIRDEGKGIGVADRVFVDIAIVLA